MKNRIYLKKYILESLIIILTFILIYITLHIIEYRSYEQNINNKINNIINEITKKYDKITDYEIMELLNSQTEDTNTLKKYGIDLKKDGVIIENNKLNKNFLITNIILITALSISLLYIFLRYNKTKNKELSKITKYIEEINKKNYKLDLDGMDEDELSILKSEIYKTTVMLKEQAENSLTDKINLKISLEDISHQLKTPLTSILLMLDNLIEDENMDEHIRKTFIRNIKREITNINFLVKSLLKLSEFDANTIKFKSDYVLLKDLVTSGVSNITPLLDLKNIKINIIEKSSPKIKCDKKWQTEALTNIIKNSVEHSYENEEIKITIDKNNLYSSIAINNKGEFIDSKDIKHIFERFYKGKNSHEESIGIGLSLSKTIIEKENGKIEVTSNEKDGTTFIVKYFN